MIVQQRINISKDEDLDVVYINFLNAPYDSADFDTEEIEDGVYRLFDSNNSHITYRYTILDFSYNDKNHLENITGINLKKI